MARACGGGGGGDGDFSSRVGASVMAVGDNMVVGQGGVVVKVFLMMVVIFP